MIALDPRHLEEAAELGRTLVSRLPGAGLLILDTDLRILVMDGDAYSSVDQRGIVGRPVRDVIPAAAWQVLGPRYRATLLNQVQSFEYHAVGDPTTHSLRMAPVLHENTVIGVMVLTEDITPRAESDRKLAASELLQRSVLEVLEEGVVVVDLEGHLLQSNRAASAILGRDLTAVDASDWWLPFRASGADDSPLDVGGTVLRTGRGIEDVRAHIQGRDGGRRSLSVNYQPLRDDTGAISGLVLSFRDITDRDQERESLLASQERLRTAHAVAGLSSWEWRPGSDELTIFQALPGEEALIGTTGTLEEMLEQIPAADRQPTRDDFTDIAGGKRDDVVRLSRRTLADGPGWVETRSRAVRDRQGNVICVRGTTQEVTQQETAKRAAAAARDFFQATFDSLSAHIAVLDEHGAILMTNRAWVEFALANDGAPAGIGDNYLAACDAAAGDKWARETAAGLRRILSGEQSRLLLEYPCHGPETRAWFLLRADRFEGPGDARVVVSHEDVSARRRAEQDVATQAALLDEVDLAVVATDLNGLVTYWNRGAEELYGWSRDEMAGRNAVDVMSPPDADSIGYVRELTDTGRAGREIVLKRKDGSTVPVSLSGRVLLDAEGVPTGRINVSSDMSERVDSERAAAAVRDYMRAVADSIGEGLFTLDPEGRVIYMNAAAEQLLGWSNEDLLGEAIHDVIHSHRPDGSVLPIDESPIFLAHRDDETLKVEDDTFFHREGRPLPVAYTASPFETEDGVHGCVVVFEEISERKAYEEDLQREANKLLMIEQIQDALAQDRFLLYAQPIVDLADRRVVQSELLLRMSGPGGEVIPPGAFLPVAEQFGLIADIDRWVIEHGIAVAARGAPVQINLSAQSIGDQSLLGHIEASLVDSGADPAQIVFEITETAIVSDETAARRFTDRLRSLGCKLALDDFGTGYGGFTYLKQLPIDCLKIDIEFVRDLTTNPGSRHVVEAVVSLAAGFDLQTVAEGVEDAETFELLRELGVDMAQGYYIARPQPFEAAAAALPTGEVTP